MQEIRKLLAIGYSVRHIVCSGWRAGYEMYAADAFGDLDTRSCAKQYFALNPLQLHAQLETLADIITEMDGLIIASGFESADFGFLTGKETNKIVGNAPSKMKLISNKAWLSSRLDELSIPHPLTYTGRELATDEAKAKEFDYPVVAKPSRGGGGTANFFCTNETELIRWAHELPDFVYQAYIKGEHASVSLLSSLRKTISVSVNEQLIGLDSLFASGPFAYCGNISPFITKLSARMCEIAEFLAEELGLLGSNGIDFVSTDEGPFVIEINPRFQGSLDTVELSTGLNLVDAQVNAVRGVLPEQIETKRYAAKAITFAKREGIVLEEFEIGRGIVDIPKKGRILKHGEPIATGIGIGTSRKDAYAEAMQRAARIQAGVRYL
jgi:hypothetical protein